MVFRKLLLRFEDERCTRDAEAIIQHRHLADHLHEISLPLHTLDGLVYNGGEFNGMDLSKEALAWLKGGTDPFAPFNNEDIFKKNPFKNKNSDEDDSDDYAHGFDDPKDENPPQPIKRDDFSRILDEYERTPDHVKEKRLMFLPPVLFEVFGSWKNLSHVTTQTPGTSSLHSSSVEDDVKFEDFLQNYKPVD